MQLGKWWEQSVLGQLLNPAEIEEVRGSRAGRWTAEEDAARVMYSQTDL